MRIQQVGTPPAHTADLAMAAVAVVAAEAVVVAHADISAAHQ